MEICVHHYMYPYRRWVYVDNTHLNSDTTDHTYLDSNAKMAHCGPTQFVQSLRHKAFFTNPDYAELSRL